MPATLEETNNSDVSELEAMIAADEAKDAASLQKSETQAPDSSTMPGEGKGAVSAPTGSGTQTANVAANEPKEGQTAKADPGTKEPSKYEKAKARQAEAWKTISETKAELARERAAVKAEREAMARQQRQVASARQQQQQQQQPSAKPAGYTAEQYEAYAQKAEAEGKFDLADAAREEAKRIRSVPPAPAPSAAQAPIAEQQPEAGQDAELDRAQLDSWAKAKAEVPEVTDPKSPVNQQLVAWLQENPAILDFPNGPYLATVFVRNSQRAARVPELESALETANKKIKELEALTTPGTGGAPPEVGQEKAWSEKSLKEMERDLEQLMRESQ